MRFDKVIEKVIRVYFLPHSVVLLVLIFSPTSFYYRSITLWAADTKPLLTLKVYFEFFVFIGFQVYVIFILPPV